MNTTKIPTPILTIFFENVVFFAHFDSCNFFYNFLGSLIKKELLRKKQWGTLNILNYIELQYYSSIVLLYNKKHQKVYNKHAVFKLFQKYWNPT